MLKDTIKKDMITAMKAKDAVAKETLKGLLSAFTNELVKIGKMPSDDLPDDDAMNVIKRTVKQRKDSISQFEKAGRNDLADDEKKELAVLEKYLPQMMLEEEILKIAKAKKEELGIEDKSKMGVLIGAVVKATEGNADGTVVKNVVMSIL